MRKVLLRIIAVLEMIGGVFGIFFVCWVALTCDIDVVSMIVGGVEIAIFALSLAAGIALWRTHPFGRKESIVIQAIQIPKIVSPAIVFMFSFGFDVWIHYLQGSRLANVGFDLRLLANSQLFINVPHTPSGFGISISACVFLLALIKQAPDASHEFEPPPLPPSEFGNQHANPPVEINPAPGSQPMADPNTL